MPSCRPIISLLRKCDGNATVIGQLYWRTGELAQHVNRSEAFTAAKRDLVKGIINARRGVMHPDMHKAAYVLEPAFVEHDSLADETIATAFYDVVEKLVPQADASGTFTNELSKYRNSEGIFARPMVQNAKSTAAPAAWWSSYGATTPILQRLAIKVLSRAVSACACERNWSTYDFIHSARRNRLTPARANDLVYVFSNLRLVNRIQDLDYQQAVVEWSDDSNSDNEDDS